MGFSQGPWAPWHWLGVSKTRYPIINLYHWFKNHKGAPLAAVGRSSARKSDMEPSEERMLLHLYSF